MEAAVSDRLEAPYVTLLMLGLRPGESLRLACDGVDLETGVLLVRQALKGGAKHDGGARPAEDDRGAADVGVADAGR